jgi:UDP-N-acetylmuramoyl-L-alanyl-D-glutamate--2,6-diaminopimelate ligase
LAELCAAIADLLVDRDAAARAGDRVISGLADDSRAVRAGDLFVAIPGTRDDGRRFVGDALAKGAVAIVAQAGVNDGGSIADARAVVLMVSDARVALARLAARCFSGARGLALTAVTGTKGKTTLTYLVESILTAAGRQTGLLGTIAYRYPGRVEAAALTTPGALHIHQLFHDMQAAGCTDAVLEASSIALDQRRLDGLQFRVGALTNVTRDHLDYHQTLDAYFNAKARLFEECLTGGVAVLHADREDGARMKARVRGRVLTVVTTAEAGGDVRLDAHALGSDGTTARFATPVGPVDVRSPLVGNFNLANIALAVGIGIAHELDRDAITTGIARLTGVPGRLERVPNDAGVLCLVDYAHTPDSLEQVLRTVRPLARGRVLSVFGCGGDRDRGKRPLMGRIGAELSDVAIITSDNPRTEDPQAILDMVVADLRAHAALAPGDVVEGACGHVVEPDRRAAIVLAARAARPGDVVLIAGKGHEDYQILGTTKIHFDDREEARAAFAERTATGATI